MTVSWTSDVLPTTGSGGVTGSITTVRSGAFEVMASSAAGAPLFAGAALDVVMRSHVGGRWNDAVITDTSITAKQAQLHVLYLSSVVGTDLMNDWGRVLAPKQQMPWLDEVVAKHLAGEMFFVPYQNTYRLSLLVRNVYC